MKNPLFASWRMGRMADTVISQETCLFRIDNAFANLKFMSDRCVLIKIFFNQDNLISPSLRIFFPVISFSQAL